MPVSEPEKKAEAISKQTSRLDNSHKGASFKAGRASHSQRQAMVNQFAANGNLW